MIAKPRDPARAPAAPDGTAARILDVAERLVQVRGFNGFSYADVAAQLGLSKPSLHYHYASKAELGQALVERYSQRFIEALAAIDRGGQDPEAKLQQYAELYAQVLEGDRMCLCGMLAADYETLPAGMRDAVVHFFTENERWLSQVVDEGRRRGDFSSDGSPADQAQLILGALEGAMLVARSYRDTARFRVAARRLLASLRRVSGAGLGD